jgi:hypothetical protein
MLVWFKYNYKNWMHSFEVSFGVWKRWLKYITALHWKCTSVNAFIPQWNFKNSASLKMYFGQRFHTPMKLQKNTFNSYLHLANPRTFSLRELNYRDGRRQVNNSRRKPVCFAQRRWYFENYWWPGRGGNPHHVVSSKLPLRNNVVYKSVNTIQY